MADDKATLHPATAAARNVEEISRIEREHGEALGLGPRISVAITTVAGTFAFAAGHVTGFLLWMAWNSFGPTAWRFDPYPYGLLTMFVSMEGVILAVFVLITQNRMSLQSDRRDHLDLQIDLLAEQEMTMVLRMLSRISDRLGVGPDEPEREQTRALMEHTNVFELMEELRRKF
jgi:uncharacterized membrane protein